MKAKEKDEMNQKHSGAQVYVCMYEKKQYTCVLLFRFRKVVVLFKYFCYIQNKAYIYMKQNIDVEKFPGIVTLYQSRYQAEMYSK